jgi:hypothetical protein
MRPGFFCFDGVTYTRQAGAIMLTATLARR